MWRETRRFHVSLALIIGGALGNGVDRAVYGAVVDFVHLHYGNFSWYIFNIADAAIVVGVAALLYESFRSERGQAGLIGTRHRFAARLMLRHGMEKSRREI
jgi:signal peptidase II